MPNIDDIVLGQDIGKWSGHKYIWLACIDCGKQRWVGYPRSKEISGRCISCAAKRHIKPIRDKNWNWKGGRYTTKRGYVGVLLAPGDFFFSMAHTDGYVLEHRLVMAKHLGRCLHRWEWIHHKNGIKDDNRIGNLELQTASEHLRMHNKGYRDGYSKGLIDGRDRQIQELKKEIKLLQWQFNNFCRSKISA